ncbi:MAG: hypothetical protein FK734_19870, partial [Asgard group archaeon]|nr:hypothetical protein [Asgard group archaeon]
MNKKLVLLIAVLVVSVGCLSGCLGESDSAKAERIGEEYLSDRFLALSLAKDYNYEYSVSSYLHGNRYTVYV